MPNEIINNNNQIQNIEFSPQSKFNELKSNKKLSVAIKETKKYIHEQCNRKDNTDEILALYKKQYNANKYARNHLKELIISSSTFVFTMLITKISDFDFSVESNFTGNNIIVDIINYFFKILPLLIGVAAFVFMAAYWIKYIIKTLFNFSSLYDLYVLPYLCDMMYNRLKSEGFNPPKIPIDD